MMSMQFKNLVNLGVIWMFWIGVFVRWSKCKVWVFYRIMMKFYKVVVNWYVD